MQPIWIPDEQTVTRSNLGAVLRRLSLEDYDRLYQWSINKPNEFWGDVVETLGIRFYRSPVQTLDRHPSGTSFNWFPESQLNIAESCFNANPNASAIIHGGPDGKLSTVSYSEVRCLANRVAHGLRRIGLKPGDAVAVFMPMTAHSVAIYLGIILAGCVVVSTADSFSAAQVRIRLEIAQAKAIFTTPFVQRGAKQLALYQRVIEANGPRAILAEDGLSKKIDVRADDLDWDEFLSDDDSDVVEHAEPDAPINILFSSGTTGDAKAIPWDHTTPIKAASDGYFHHDIHPGDVVAWPTNLGWMMGPWLIFATMINRGTIALFNGPPAGKAFGQFIQDARVNMLGIIPSMIQQWHKTGCMEDFDWSAIRAFSSTGECSNPVDMRYLSQLAGGKPIIEYCGGTEIGGGYLTSTVVQANYPSTFSTPALGNAFVILDEGGQPTESGELFLMPPALGLSRRLLNRDHQSVYYQGTPVGPDARQLRRHGDQIQALPHGYYRSLGRADDTLNLGGIKVSTAEIEQALSGFNDVEEVAAIAINKTGGGPSRLVICAVAESNARLIPEQLLPAMQQMIKTKLNPLFKIHDVYIIDRLSRTASHKIARRELRNQYQEHVKKDGLE